MSLFSSSPSFPLTFPSFLSPSAPLHLTVFQAGPHHFVSVLCSLRVSRYDCFVFSGRGRSVYLAQILDLFITMADLGSAQAGSSQVWAVTGPLRLPTFLLILSRQRRGYCHCDQQSLSSPLSPYWCPAPLLMQWSLRAKMCMCDMDSCNHGQLIPSPPIIHTYTHTHTRPYSVCLLKLWPDTDLMLCVLLMLPHRGLPSRGQKQTAWRPPYQTGSD